MEEQVKDVISGSMGGFRLPRYDELPNVGLYLEQATKYVNQCIRPLGFEDVTGSMIRNYVKQGLIANPVRKQYYAHHLARLIALALVKQVANLDCVSSMFRILDRHESYTEEIAYNYFCSELENVLYFRFGLQDETAELGVTSSLEKEMLRSIVTAVSHVVYLNRCIRVLEDSSTEK